MFTVTLALAVSACIVLYLYALNERLKTPHPLAKAKPLYNAAQFAEVEYHSINMLNSIPRDPTHKRYAVVGGSGFVGMYLVRLLLLRGETSIRIIDLAPPPPDLVNNPSVSWSGRIDITNQESIQKELGSLRPEVVYLTAAIIRFWERARYTYPSSHKVNALGVQNVVETLKIAAPQALLIFTSSSDVVLPRPKFLRLGFDRRGNGPTSRIAISDTDLPLSPADASESCYAITKLKGESIVREADKKGGIRTGIIRPGLTLVGPNDRLISSTLSMPRFPVFDAAYMQTQVNVWDVCAAHLLYEGALTRIPDEVGGDAFLVTGNDDGSGWCLQDTRRAIQNYTKRPLVFDHIPPLVIFLLAHLVEATLFVRYHFLKLFTANPSLVPRGVGELVYMQPATLEYLRDVIIDDSRARRMLGYRPQWSLPQSVRQTVEAFELGASGHVYGLQLKD